MAARTVRGIDAEPVVLEILGAKRGREQRVVLKIVRRARHRVPRAHGKREGLVLLDEIEEGAEAELLYGRVDDVSRPPGRRDEVVSTAESNDAGSIAGADDLEL